MMTNGRIDEMEPAASIFKLFLLDLCIDVYYDNEKIP
jgi:hypothetical protein